MTHYSNLLCDLLRGIVATTKAAALQYPSPSAAQDMVDRVKELGHSTQQFRRVRETPKGRQARMARLDGTAVRRHELGVGGVRKRSIDLHIIVNHLTEILHLRR